MRHIAFLSEIASCEEASPEFYEVSAGYLMLRLLDHSGECPEQQSLRDSTRAVNGSLTPLSVGEGRQLLEAIMASLPQDGSKYSITTITLLLKYAKWLERRASYKALALDVLETVVEALAV